MTKNAERGLIAFLIVVALSGFAGAFLVGCQHYEPPGRDLWRAL